jgi:hypothetical protein
MRHCWACPGNPSSSKDSSRSEMDTRVKPAYDEECVVAEIYSITAACSDPCACLRSAALVEPIMIASGIAHSVTIITSW